VKVFILFFQTDVLKYKRNILYSIHYLYKINLSCKIELILILFNGNAYITYVNFAEDEDSVLNIRSLF